MPSSRMQRLHAFARKRAVSRIFISLGALVLLYGLFGYFVLPHIIRSQVESLTREKLHRHGTLGKVEVNPFTLSVTAHDFKLMEPHGDAVFASFDTLTLNLAAESVLRLAPVVQQLRLNKPYLHLVRTDAHHYNFDDLLAPGPKQPSSQQTARFSINNIEVDGGRIAFRDQPTKTSHTVSDISLGVPFISSLPSQVNIFVEPLLRAHVDGTPLLIKGKAHPFAANRDALVDLNLDGLDLTRYLGYLPFEPSFRLPDGRLDAHLHFSFRQPANRPPLLVVDGDAALKSVRLTAPDGAPVLKLPEMTISLGDSDLLGGHVNLKKAALNGLEVDAALDRDGRLSLLDLLPASSPAPAHAAKAATAWHIALDELDLRHGTLHFADEQAARPLQVQAEQFDLAIRKVEADTGRKTVRISEISSDSAGLLLRQGKPAAQPDAAAAASGNPAPQSADTAPAPVSGSAYVLRVDSLKFANWSARVEDARAPKPLVTTISPLSLSVRNFSTASAAPAQVALSAAVNGSGRLALDGKLRLAPFQTTLALDAGNVDILPLQPFVADKLNLRFTRGSLSGKGSLQLEDGPAGGLKGEFKGDVSLNNLATVDAASGDDFLRWQSLSFGGVDARLGPFALNVDNAALDDFFARIVIDPRGRINLQDIVRANAKSPDSSNKTAGGTNAATAPAPAGEVPPIRIRKLSFSGGRVRFTDNFIQPNYSASLMNLGGVVAGLSSDPSASASVDLHGEVNQAPLSITGRVNPLRRNLLLDLKANVHGMELAALSPYSDKYIGYGIEKGKLSFEANYHVENRQLSATNRVILNQLTLSDKSTQKNTNSALSKLPVKLAIALLQDRNGVIDVNVPVAGSLDDPQFSIGGIVLKVIGNAILKTVSQPFALLGSLFENHGSGQLSSVMFDPGRASILPPAQNKLETLAKALDARPALQLEITGWAGSKADEQGLKRAALERRVRALKRKDLLDSGKQVPFGSVTVSADEYPDLLKRVYRNEKFQKPRNALGLPKSLPVKDMEDLILAHTDIDEGDLIALANRRAEAVKDWLLKFGHIPGERIFILASKAGDAARKEGAAGSTLSKAEFSLR